MPLQHLVPHQALHKDLVLRSECVVEALALDAGGVYEFLDRRGFVASLPKQVHGGIESLFLIELFCTRHGTVIRFLERMVKYGRSESIEHVG